MKNKKNENIKKLIVVGDVQCGKSCLLAKIECNELSEDFLRYYYGYHREIATKETIFEGRKINLALWDTSAYEDYARLRPLSYANTDVVLICFAIDNPKSIENIQTIWHPEIKHYMPNVHYLLIGTKLDLRIDRANEAQFVTYEEGLKMSKVIHADGFIQCSVKSSIGFQEIIDESARKALNSTGNTFGKKRTCVII